MAEDRERRDVRPTAGVDFEWTCQRLYEAYLEWLAAGRPMRNQGQTPSPSSP